MAGTVREFKETIEDRFGGRGHHTDFTMKSVQNMKFWEKLNRLGARNIREFPPESVPDLDSMVELSDQEWAALELELNQLLKA